MAADLPDVIRIFQDAMCNSEWIPAALRGPVDFAAATAGEEIQVAVDAHQRVTGFVSIWRPAAFIHHLYVDPAQRRQGYGSALLDSISGKLPKPWQLKCVERNRAALSFYQAQGWRPIERGQGEHGTYVLLELAADP